MFNLFYLEGIVCCLDLCKLIKELKVKQDSKFYWFKNTFDPWQLHYPDSEENKKIFLETNKEIISAFTSSELINILPKRLAHNGVGYNLKEDFYNSHANDYYDCHIYYYAEGKILTEFVDRSEPDARAKILIHLIKNGHVSAGHL